MEKVKSYKREDAYKLLKNNAIEQGLYKNEDFLDDSLGNKSEFYLNQKSYSGYIHELDKDLSNENNIKKIYESGQGKELSGSFESQRKLPKMACIGSSSRFCVEALIKNQNKKYIPEIKLENRLLNTTSGSNKPNPDAFINNGKENYYFELKCCEIYDKNNARGFSKTAYENILINSSEGFQFDSSLFYTKQVKNKDKINNYLHFNYKNLFNKQSNINFHFDTVQFIKHLIGLASLNYENKCKEKYIRKTEDQIIDKNLIYLFFKPISTNNQEEIYINKVFNELTQEIVQLINNTKISSFMVKHKIQIQFYVQEAKYFELCNSENTKLLVKSSDINYEF